MGIGWNYPNVFPDHLYGYLRSKSISSFDKYFFIWRKVWPIRSGWKSYRSLGPRISLISLALSYWTADNNAATAAPWI